MTDMPIPAAAPVPGRFARIIALVDLSRSLALYAGAGRYPTALLARLGITRD